MVTYPNRVFEANIEASSPGEQGVLRGAEPMWVVFNGSDVVFERTSYKECDLFAKQCNPELRVLPKGDVDPAALERWQSLLNQRRLTGNLNELHFHECQLSEIASRREKVQRAEKLASTLIDGIEDEIRQLLHERLTELLIQEAVVA